MFPFEVLNSEVSAANLLEQVRWRDDLYCPRCQSESVIKHGSYRAYQWYRCKDCDRSTRQKPLQQPFSSLSPFNSDRCLDSASYRSEIEQLTPTQLGFRILDCEVPTF